MKLSATTAQTVGPFFHIGLESLFNDTIADSGGQRVVIEGRIVDGDGVPVTDAMVEAWQADATGAYLRPGEHRPEFRGFARVATDDDGNFRICTIKPGRVGPQAPHVEIALFMRGLLKHLVTRIYFPDEPSNDEDAVLKLVSPERRPTLVAKRGPNAATLEWNVVLQGDNETVFFDC